jgi:pimeloyl-ACP methyl ester carboxylesterase
VSTVRLHGRTLHYRRLGSGPPLVLLHGIASDGSTWDAALEALAARHEVLVPDLPGHGGSDPPVGDHSTGAYACVVRDLLEVLDVGSVTVVGHSLGGGVAMQFAYQFPELAERLVLLNSGGLGREVSPLMRAAALPGAELVVPVLASGPLRLGGRIAAKALGAIGRTPSTDLREGARSLAGLSDPDARRAFLGTVRTLVGPRGQIVSASDRLYLTELLPSLLIWGARDTIIPLAHGHAAHAAMPGSRLVVIDHAGHFPHIDEPEQVAALIGDFVATTERPRTDRSDLRRRLLAAG